MDVIRAMTTTNGQILARLTEEVNLLKDQVAKLLDIQNDLQRAIDVSSSKYQEITEQVTLIKAQLAEQQQVLFSVIYRMERLSKKLEDCDLLSAGQASQAPQSIPVNPSNIP